MPEIHLEVRGFRVWFLAPPASRYALLTGYVCARTFEEKRSGIGANRNEEKPNRMGRRIENGREKGVGREET